MRVITKAVRLSTAEWVAVEADMQRRGLESWSEYVREVAVRPLFTPSFRKVFDKRQTRVAR